MKKTAWPEKASPPPAKPRQRKPRITLRTYRELAGRDPLLSGRGWSPWYCVSTPRQHVSVRAVPVPIPTKPGVYEFGICVEGQSKEGPPGKEARGSSGAKCSGEEGGARNASGSPPPGGVTGKGKGEAAPAAEGASRTPSSAHPGANIAAGQIAPPQPRQALPHIAAIYVGKTDEKETVQKGSDGRVRGGLASRIRRYARQSSHKWQLFRAYWAAGYPLWVRWFEAHDMALRSVVTRAGDTTIEPPPRTGASRAKELESQLLSRYEYACNYMENGKKVPRLPEGVPHGVVDLEGALRERRSERLAAKARSKVKKAE